MNDHLLYTLEIVVACFIVELGFRLYDRLKNKRLDIGCDHCNLARPLKRTIDRQFFLCRVCMKAYMAEHGSEFTEEQLRKARWGYRRRSRP